MDRERLAVGLVALVATFSLVACGTAGSGASTPEVHTVAAWAPCYRPGVGRSGELDAFRMGAVDFSSATTGVALTAGSFQCFRRVDGGVQSFDLPAHERLAVSRDGGLTWMPSGVPLPTPIPAGNRYQELVLGHGGSVWAVTSEGRPFLTTDQGRTWQPVSLPRPVTGLASGSRYLWALSCPRAAGVSCTPELFRRPLGSGSWSTVNLPRHASALTAWAPLGRGNAIVSVLSAGRIEGRLLISSDRGMRWRIRPAPRWRGRPCEVADLTASGSRIWLLCLSGQAAAGSSTKAVLESADGGRSWQVRSSVMSLTAHWKPGRLLLGEPSALAAGSATRLWLAFVNGMSGSNDAGRHWPLNPSINAQGSPTAFDVISSTHAWLIAPGAGIWRTTNGNHWSALGPLNTG